MKKKIMVVDDSDVTRYTVKDGLEEIDPDCNVASVEGGEECFEYLKNNGLPDLILLDVMMPRMNGWEVFKALRKNQDWKKIPIVFLTARTDAFSKGFGKILGDAFIEKPFELHALKEKIEEILSKPYEISETKEKVIEDMMENAIK